MQGAAEPAAIAAADQSKPAMPERGSALEVLRVFLRLGLTSFGGPVAHLGYYRSEFVERRRWLDEPAFADIVALCQFLPGPASSQVAISLGILRVGLPGPSPPGSVLPCRRPGGGGHGAQSVPGPRARHDRYWRGDPRPRGSVGGGPDRCHHRRRADRLGFAAQCRGSAAASAPRHSFAPRSFGGRRDRLSG